MDIWARSADDLVCHFQRFHRIEMVEEALYSAPVYWLLGYTSSFIVVFIIIPSAKVYLLIKSLKSMEFFKYHLRLSRSRPRNILSVLDNLNPVHGLCAFLIPVGIALLHPLFMWLTLYYYHGPMAEGETLRTLKSYQSYTTPILEIGKGCLQN